jgi:Ca2+-binding RTX toxin-like protein
LQPCAKVGGNDLLTTGSGSNVLKGGGDILRGGKGDGVLAGGAGQMC